MNGKLEDVRWEVPLQIRAAPGVAPRAVLLTRGGQRVRAGDCQKPLSVDAGAIGYYRVQYDPATLAVDTRGFDTLPDGDRIALLDDQWALVEARDAQLASYLALAQRMGSDLDTRAWQQITTALGTIEYDERGSAGHDAFAAYARSIIKPLEVRLGWDSRPGDGPDVLELRHTVIEDLGAWGDPAVIAEARRRFAQFVRDPHAIAPDEQAMILDVVGEYADAPTFDELHKLAGQSQDEAQKSRLYQALARVRNRELAAQAAQIAIGPEIPPQLVTLRLQMFASLRTAHPKLAWNVFSGNAARILAPFGELAPLIEAQYIPQMFWNSLPPGRMQAWLEAHVPAQMGPQIAKGMESVRFQVALKDELVPEVTAYMAVRARHT